MNICFNNFYVLTVIKEYLFLEDFRNVFQLCKSFNSRFKDHFETNEQFKKLIKRIDDCKLALSDKKEEYNNQKLKMDHISDQDEKKIRELSKRDASFSAMFTNRLPMSIINYFPSLLKKIQHRNELKNQCDKYCLDDMQLDEIKLKEIKKEENSIQSLCKFKSTQENHHRMTKKIQKFLSQNRKKLIEEDINFNKVRLSTISSYFLEDNQTYQVIHGYNPNSCLFFAAKYEKSGKKLITLIFQERCTTKELSFINFPEELRENHYCWNKKTWNCSQSNYLEKSKEYESVEELEMDLVYFTRF
jgi:hypothetical protein